MSNRRSFLRQLFAAPAALALADVRAILPDAPAVAQVFAKAETTDGKQYIHVRAGAPLTPGTLVAWNAKGYVVPAQLGTIIGVAVAPLRRGDYGWVQVRGSAAVRFTS